ncbi:HAMP domain-containing sensor histidine kinase [Fodinicola feengrottensis]|uniref:Signal transduction histidine-protein kinase/phosphatase MprB n=2 Tax=Fodinicola feengrottensis TaxID=435914 RepID=A0ABN2GND0_9ACTN
MLVAIAVTAMMAVVFLVPLASLLVATAERAARSEAERQAYLIGSALLVTTDRGTLNRAIAQTAAGRDHRVAVSMTDGSVLGANLAPAAAAALPRVRAAGTPLTVPTDGGEILLSPVSMPQGGTAVVAVYVTDAQLHQSLPLALAICAVSTVLLVAVAVFVADRLATGTVRPTKRLAAAAHALGTGALDTRVRPAGPPEIMAAGQALNELADRIVALLAAEREMVADLSHRLRTPLTALRFSAEALPAGPDREQILDAAVSLEREVDALIAESRRARTPRPPARTDVASAVADRTRFWSALAEEQGRHWAFHRTSDQPAIVAVAEKDLDAALDALLGNVIRHTPPGAAAHIQVIQAAAGVSVVVDDAGPGIAAPARALRRGTSATGSTGLGLDIARRTVESAGGRLEIGRSPAGGTRVRLVFPYAQKPGQPVA